MQTIKNYWKSILSIVLVLVLLIQITPLEIVAQAISPDTALEDTIDVSKEYEVAETEEIAEDAYVLGEIDEFREESVKHFRLSDGSFVAMQYDMPVHFKDASGDWQDIDNTLNLDRVDGKLVYTANAGDLKKHFASAFTGSFLFGIEYDGYSVEMSVADYEKNYKIITGEDRITKEAGATSMVSENVALQLVNDNQENAIRISAAVSNPKEESILAIDHATIADVNTPEKVVSALEYSNIYPDTDFVYSNNSYDIKESIVISEKQEAYVYSFILNLRNLTATESDDGDIILINDQGETVFSIPAPYMIDANGVDSREVYYDLTQKAGSYVLTVTADEEWINDSSRAFPVILDPTLSVNAYMNTTDASRLVGTYVTEGSPNQAHAGYQQMYVGLSASAYPEFKEAQIFVGVETLPSIPYNCAVTSAQLRMYNYDFSACGVNSIKIGAFEVASSCPADKSYDDWIKHLTWASRPSTGSDVLDYVTTTSSTVSSFLSWDLTGTVVNWYKNSNSSRAVQLKLLDRAQYNANSKYALASFLGYQSATAGTQPVLCVTYRSTNGIEDYYTYQTASACNAGQVYISDFTNCMTIAKPDVTLDLAPTSFTLTHYYNSSICGSYFSTNGNTNINTCLFTNMILGAGWKLSVQQTIFEKTIGGNLYLIYTDADGTEHYFYNSSTNTFLDEDGLGLKIVKSTSSGNKIYTMTDTDVNNTWVFHNGYLISQTDHNGNAIYIAYNNNYSASNSSWKPTAGTTNRIVQIVQHTDNGQSNNSIVFATLKYNSSKFLKEIVDYAGRITKFEYTGTVLTSITNPDGTVVSYEYAPNSTLISAYDGDSNYGLEFSYNLGVQSSGHNYRPINEVAEYTITEGAKSYGNRFRMFRNATLMSTVRYFGADSIEETNDDLVVFNVFDYYGRTITSYTTDYSKENILGVSAGAYKANSSTNTASNNRLSKTASSGQHVNNLLLNSSIEKETGTNGVLGWEKQCTGNGNAIISEEFSFWTGRTPDRIRPYVGNKLLKTYQGEYSGSSELRQNTTLEPGTYTFSAYASTYCMRNFDPNGTGDTGVYIAIYDSIGNEIGRSNVITYFTDPYVEDGWERLSAQFSLSTADTVTLAVCQTGSYGVAAFDNLQLEKTDTMSSVNLLQDAGFELQSGNNYWGARTIENTSADSSGSTFNRGAVVKLVGNPSEDVHVSQTVKINKSSNTTFLLSGWGKAHSVSFAQKDDSSTYPKFFGLIATIRYVGDPESSVETQYVPFNPLCQEWQYATGIIVPKKDNKIVSTITVSLAYDKNANTAYFDNISLIQEPVQTYSYDSKGNPIQATDGKAKSACEYFDNTNKLKSYTTPSGNKYTLTYSGNNVATETLAGLTNYSYYNSAGCVTTSMTRVGTSGPFLQSSNVYDSSMNHRTSTTDVNGKTTYYAYSGTYHTLSRTTQIANGQNVTRGYGYYSENGRTKQTYIDSIGSLQYEYSEGMMSNITHKSFQSAGSTANPFWQRYNMSYDGFGNMLSISIEGSTDGSTYTQPVVLASYTYGNNNGNLQSMQYGNGAEISYTYDVFDRKTTESYNDSKNTVYQYNYDAEGNLSKQSGTWQNAEGEQQNETYFYGYDSLGRLIHSKEYNDGAMVQRTEHLYDTSNRLTAQNWILGGSSVFGQTYSYSNGETGDGTITSITNQASVNGTELTLPTVSYSYNTLRQLTRKTSDNFYRAYAYESGSAANQKTSHVQYMNYRNTNGGLIIGYKYSYNDQGFISAICNSGDLSSVLGSYSYDKLGQLVSASDTTGTYSYTYDTAGNIRTSTKNGVTHNYSYTDAAWKDLLTAFDGHAITYDEIGNPETYYNGNSYSFEWEKGRQLASAAVGGASITYDYDMAGVRSSKTVNGKTYNYTTLSGLVMQQTCEDETLYFIYDDSSQPYALISYKQGAGSENPEIAVYYYALNLQGDVVALLYSDGTAAAYYEYDPWGKVTVKDPTYSVNTSATYIGNINPLRYRGYYFDNETGLYYLQTRYYDPAIGRFINADTFATTDIDGLLSTNMFAYCENNPVMLNDPDGSAPQAIIGAFVGMASSVVGQVIQDCIAGQMSSWQTYVGAAVGGAVGGAVFGMTGNSNLANGAEGLVSTFTTKILDRDKTESFGEVLFDSFAGGVNGMINANLSSKIPLPKKISGRNGFGALYKSGLTKLRNGHAKKMSFRVVRKGIKYTIASNAWSTIVIGAARRSSR